jgi:membrane protease YdiL (CAAX protease family)
LISLKSSINKHQIIAFFTFTLGINFLLGIPGILLMGTSQLLLRIVGFYLLRVAVFSPVISGMLVTGMHDTQSRDSRREASWIIFVVIGVLAWAVGTLQMSSTMSTQGGLPIRTIMLLNGPIALLPAFVFCRAFSRNPNMRKYLVTLVKPSGHLVYYFIAFFTFPIIHILGNLITSSLDGQPFGAQGLSMNLIWVAIITFLSVFFFTGGINEESGWRGFALPRLQVRFSPILAGLIIWSCHVIWELNGDVLMNLFMGTQVSWPALSRLVWMPSWTILFVWVYNRTNGSILAPAIFHASMNMMNPLMDVLPTSAAGTILLVLFALFVVVYDRMWKKRPFKISSYTRD